MTFEIYQFILCAFVFTLLTALFTILVTMLVRYALRMIRAGLFDEDIKTEYLKNKGKKPSVIGKIFDWFLLGTCTVALLVSFAMSLSVSSCCNGTPIDGVPKANVVRSESMSYISPNHKYLKEGDVTDQLQMFDVVFVEQLPSEDELKVNDIVVYKFRDSFIIHRIVAIEERNDAHPNQRYFLLQGDANDLSDRFPVTYDSMVGIYNGTRIPFVGSFVLFMQSPAGWLCILLVVFAMIATPIAEKKLNDARKARLLLLFPPVEDAIAEVEATATVAEETVEPVVEEAVPPVDEPVATAVDVELAEDVSAIVTPPSPFAHLRGARDARTFDEKLAVLPIARGRYETICSLLARIEKIRAISSKKAKTFKVGKIAIVKFTIRGKTLNAHLALQPADYEGTKYIFADVSATKAYANYPMRVKVTSDRQAKWVVELLHDIVAKHGLTLAEVALPIPTEVEDVPFSFASLPRRASKTFAEKLELSPKAKARYNAIVEEVLCRMQGIRTIESKKYRTYKRKSTPVVKFSIRGKTLNAYIALPTAEFADSKYIFVDSSETRAYAKYPMRVKVTSDRQAKWVVELLKNLAERHEIKLVDPIFARLRRGASKTFAERLELSPKAKARYVAITAELDKIEGLRKIEGKKRITYKRKSKPIARFSMRGKTLNAYVALPPLMFAGTKYIYTDVSATKSYANYPMRVKVTSDRQVRWLLELLMITIHGGDL